MNTTYYDSELWYKEVGGVLNFHRLKYFSRSDGYEKTFRIQEDEFDGFTCNFKNVYVKDFLYWKVLPEIPSVEICSSLALTRWVSKDEEKSKPLLQRYHKGVPTFTVDGKNYSVNHQFRTVFDIDCSEHGEKEYPLRSRKDGSAVWIFNSEASELRRYESAQVAIACTPFKMMSELSSGTFKHGLLVYRERVRSHYTEHYGDVEHYQARCPKDLRHLKIK